MRDAMKNLGGDMAKVNPLCPVELVIDHSVMIDHYGTKDALELNAKIEFKRNEERYTFLRSEEHTSELQSLMRISYAVFCLKKKQTTRQQHTNTSKLRKQ